METGDIRIDALLQEGWGLATGLPGGVPIEISYRFMESAQGPAGQSSITRDLPGFQPMMPGQREATREVLGVVASQIGVSFREVGPSEPAMLRFGLSLGIDGQGEDASETGYTMYQGPSGLEPIVLINRGKTVFQESPDGTRFRDVILHEVGHALGLKHPGKYFDHEEGPFLPEELDTLANTVMSYNYDASGTMDKFAEFDLLALRYLYGGPENVATGDEVNTVSVENPDYLMSGSAVSDAITYHAGPRGEYAKTVATSWGNDRLHVVEMDSWDRILFQGGEGVDTLILDEDSRFARDLLPADGAVQFYLLDGQQDKRFFDLDSVERVHFTDRALALDVDQASGQAFRIYQAAFGREPDKAGLGYWIAQRDGGMLLDDIADRFLTSDEFQVRYGSAPSDEGFLEALYANVLGRQYDEGGFEFWLGELSQNEVDRAHVLASFSESTENRESLAAVMGQGIEYEVWMG